MRADVVFVPPAASKGDLRIGEVAALAGVSTRTLRYYEQLGMLQPSERSPGGARRYSANDVARLLRIRELQSLMGFNLSDIQLILKAEDRLQTLRDEFHGGTPSERRREIVMEAMRVTEELRTQVVEKLERVRAFLETLDEKAVCYQVYLGQTAERII